MAASIRGHQGQVRLFKNGALLNIVHLTKVSVTQDSSFSRTAYVGNSIHEGDQSMEGWSGSCELQVKDAEVDKLIDGIVTANLNGIGVSDYTFMTTENYGDGTSSSYVYFDVQWKMSREQGGSNEKVTKRLEFQAAGRQAL